MIRYALFVLLIARIIQNSEAQETKFLGRVMDASSKKPIADVLITYQDSIQVRTNFLGYFELNGHPSQIKISHVNYPISEVRLDPTNPKFLVSLSPIVHRLQEVNLAEESTTEIVEKADSLANQLLQVTDRKAQFPSGFSQFNQYIRQTIDSLKTDSSDLLPVEVYFTISNQGKVMVDSTTSTSALTNTLKSIYQNSQAWIPAAQASKPVSSYFMQRIVSEKNEVFTIVEQQPEFPGGQYAFFKFIADNMIYPAPARRYGIQGRVYVQFVVDRDGSVIEAKAVKGIGGGCDEEAVRVVSSAPKFSPGMQNGKPVKVRMVLPIIFKLDDYSPREKVEDNLENWIKTKLSTLKIQNRPNGIIYVAFDVSNKLEVVNARIINEMDTAASSIILKLIQSIPESYLKVSNIRGESLILPIRFSEQSDTKIANNLPQGLLLGVVNLTSPDDDYFSGVSITAYGIERVEKSTIYRPQDVEQNLFSNVSISNENGHIVLGRSDGPGKFDSFEEAFKSEDLEVIRIVKKNVSYIPSVIGDFKHINFIDLEGNQIESIPDEFANLVKLENLYLPENKLKALPANFYELKILKVLSLAGNQFDHFPLELINLKRIEALDLGHNQLESIPPEIGEMKSLKFLVLSNNNLKTLPKEITKLNLSQLIIGGNPISEEEIQYLKDTMKQTQIVLE